VIAELTAFSTMVLSDIFLSADNHGVLGSAGKELRR
jgi:hypothetical protein